MKELRADQENDFLLIEETTTLILGALWEQMYLYDKQQDKEYFLGEFDGVSDFGLIDANSEWALAGYTSLFIWKKGEVIEINKDELKCIEGVKLLSPNEVELTIDSLNLNNNRSIWKISIDSLELTKLST